MLGRNDQDHHVDDACQTGIPETRDLIWSDPIRSGLYPRPPQDSVMISLALWCLIPFCCRGRSAAALHLNPASSPSAAEAVLQQLACIASAPIRSDPIRSDPIGWRKQGGGIGSHGYGYGGLGGLGDSGGGGWSCLSKSGAETEDGRSIIRFGQTSFVFI